MRTLRFMFKSICSSSLNWRAGGMYLNAPSREAYRSWKTSWLYTTASHSGQTPFPSHWTQRINQDIWWHGSTQWWHCFRPFQQKNGFENPGPADASLCTGRSLPLKDRKKKRLFFWRRCRLYTCYLDAYQFSFRLANLFSHFTSTDCI